MLHTVALLPALVACDLTRSDQRCALRLIKQSFSSSLPLNRILISLPKNSQSLEWDLNQYDTYLASEVSQILDFVWEAGEVCHDQHCVLLLQRSSRNGMLEGINIFPFINSYNRFYAFPEIRNNTPLLMLSLYMDGFCTWVTRSGNVTAIYMSLAQLSLYQLNKAVNVHLISLILNGADEAVVLNLISTDINKMVRNDLQNVWIANGPRTKATILLSELSNIKASVLKFT